MYFSVLISSGYTSKSGIGGSYGGFIPSFLRSLHTVFRSDYMLTFPLAMQDYSVFSKPSLAIIVRRLFDDDHFDWYEVVSHFSFDLHFSNNE